MRGAISALIGVLSTVSEPDSHDITRSFVQLANGTSIGRYRIIEKIGAGGMGEVYLAEDTELNRRVTLKFLPPHICQDVDCRARFKREAQAAAKLNHPNIVTIHEVGEFKERPYLVAEYAGDKTLYDLIKSKDISPSDAINIVAQICEGLEEAHNAGIVHRDIKPSNVVLEKSGRPKIVDFGLAVIQGGQKVTKSGSTVGTVGYMSPEQLRGEPVDKRTDLFSAGVLLYELITGKHPFLMETEAATQHRILRETPEPLARYKSGVPDGLQEIVDRALEKDVQLRFQSAADLSAELKRLRRRSSDPDLIGRADSRVSRVGRFRVRTLVLAGVALVVIGGLYLTSRRYDVTRAHPKKQHLAVIPFVNLGQPASNPEFSDGLAETISSKLTQLADVSGQLSVVPSSEVREKKIESAAKARRVFGVDLAITGSIQRFGDEIRITLNLVDAKRERQIRSTVISERMSDLPRLQDMIVEQMVVLCDLQIPPGPHEALASVRTGSSDAYYSYLQGQGFLARYADTRSIDSAIFYFRAAAEQDSGYAPAFSGLGEAYWRKYQNTMDDRWVTPAIKHSSRALELNDQNASVFLSLGIIHRGTGHYEEAVVFFEKALKIDSTKSESYRELALAYESLRRYDLAESTYRRSIALDPDNWQNYYYLSSFAYRSGRTREAILQAGVAESLAPEAAYPYYLVGSLYIFLGVPEKAKEMLQYSIRLEPNHAAYSNLGAIYQGEDRDSLAIAMYERAVKLGDRDYRAWSNLAAMYRAMPGRRRDAAAAYDSAIVLGQRARGVNPNDAELLCHLADCYASVNNRDSSLALARLAVRLAPTEGEVLVRAALIHEALGDRTEALDLIARAVQNGYSLERIRQLEDLRALTKDRRFSALHETKGN